MGTSGYKGRDAPSFFARELGRRVFQFCGPGTSFYPGVACRSVIRGLGPERGRESIARRNHFLTCPLCRTSAVPAILQDFTFSCAVDARLDRLTYPMGLAHWMCRVSTRTQSYWVQGGLSPYWWGGRSLARAFLCAKKSPRGYTPSGLPAFPKAPRVSHSRRRICGPGEAPWDGGGASWKFAFSANERGMRFPTSSG